VAGRDSLDTLWIWIVTVFSFFVYVLSASRMAARIAVAVLLVGLLRAGGNVRPRHDPLDRPRHRPSMPLSAPTRCVAHPYGCDTSALGLGRSARRWDIFLRIRRQTDVSARLRSCRERILCRSSRVMAADVRVTDRTGNRLPFLLQWSDGTTTRKASYRRRD